MKFSVAMCTYNGEKYIAEQLESILKQSTPVDEIIVSDDGSTDNTLEIAREILRESGIPHKIVCNRPAKGVSANFLSAMKMTSGDYCFTCDQDDIWNNNKVEVFAAEAEASYLDLYFSDGTLVDGQAEPLGGTLWEAIDLSHPPMDASACVQTLIRRPMVTGAAMMVSRALIERAPEVPQGILHDEWFSMLAATADSIQPICRQTFLYRQHGKNVVGVKRFTFPDRVRIWWNNLLSIEKLRKNALARVSAMAAAAQGTGYEAVSKKALAFWETLNSFSQISCWKQICIATKLFCARQYSEFYTGSRGYLRDILCALAVRK